ncbi:MAG: hypothetical protein WC486_03715 [Candidatus Omnitrophota bacterium]
MAEEHKQEGAGTGEGAGAEAGAGAAGAGAGAGQGAGEGAGAGQQGGQGAGQQGTFTIPKEYAEKGWAKKIKTQDDVFKLIDNLDGLAGKKMVVPDFEKSTPEEINTYLSTLRGDTKIEDYKFPEGANKEITDKIAKILYDNGTPKAIGNKIIVAYSELEKSVIAQKYSKEGMEAVLKTSFGDDYQKTAGASANLLAKHLSAEDRKVLEKIPNEHLGLIYRLTNNIIKAYGIKEEIDGSGGQGGAAAGDVEATRKAIRAEIAELSKRSHTAEEKQKLIDKLEATYKK